MLMRIFHFCPLLLATVLLSCSSDDAYDSDAAFQKEYATRAPYKNMAKASSEIKVWTGEKKIVKSRKVKIILGPEYDAYIPSGIYIGYEYTISAQTPENENLIYRNAIDDACGFLPKSTSVKVIQRGTRAYESEISENSYILKTICFQILSRIDGATPSKPLYIPCRPEDAVLKYKVVSIAD